MSIDERAFLRAAFGFKKNGVTQTYRLHGKVLSDSQNRMELGIAQIYKKNKNARL